MGRGDGESENRVGGGGALSRAQPETQHRQKRQHRQLFLYLVSIGAINIRRLGVGGKKMLLGWLRDTGIWMGWAGLDGIEDGEGALNGR